jgi:hypothetical protein
MSAISDYLELKLLDLVFNATAYTAPVTLTVALFKTDPNDDGSGTEVQAGDDANYARQAITFGAAAAGAVANDAEVNFPAAAGGANYNVSHFAIYDQLSNLLWKGPLGTVGAPVVKNIAAGEVLSFPIGSLVCTLD